MIQPKLNLCLLFIFCISTYCLEMKRSLAGQHRAKSGTLYHSPSCDAYCFICTCDIFDQYACLTLRLCWVCQKQWTNQNRISSRKLLWVSVYIEFNVSTAHIYVYVCNNFSFFCMANNPIQAIDITINSERREIFKTQWFRKERKG